MQKLFERNLLPLAVFITGACVLIVEIVAVRVLSPHYGNTIFTVSSVISVILAALSIGYYAGGKLADRRPSLRWFFGIILLSGLLVIAFHFVGIVTLPLLSARLSITMGPLLSSLLLFFLPALLLGTLSPYAIKLQSDHLPHQGVGSVAGIMFFWSTLGSIMGSLLAGFYLIPNFGIDQIFVTTGIVLFILGFIPLAILGSQKMRLLQLLIAILILLFVTFSAARQARGNDVYSAEGIYEKITIQDVLHEGRPARYLRLDRSYSGAMFLDSNDPTDLVHTFAQYYRLYKIFKPDVREALVIGGGAYSLPKAMLAEWPEATVDVSEIEAPLYDLAKEYFSLQEDPRLHNSTDDGRRLLRETQKKYDVIFSDVYYSLFSIPAHFTTQEFFTLAKEKMAKDGILIANVIGDLSPEQPSILMTEIKTFRSVFPNSYFFATRSPKHTGVQNFIFVGYNSATTVDLDSAAVSQHSDPLMRSLSDHALDVALLDLSPYPIFTDNFSPAEYFTAKVLQRQFGG